MNIKLLNLGFGRRDDGTYVHYESGVQCEEDGSGLFTAIDIDGTVATRCTEQYIMMMVERSLNDEQDI